jgi:hypothetical protein
MTSKRYGTSSMVCTEILPLSCMILLWHSLITLTDAKLASMVLSSATSLRANNDSCSVLRPTTSIGIKMGNQKQHLTAQNEMFLPSDPAVPEGFEQYQNWMQPIGPIDDIYMDPTSIPTSKPVSMPIQSGARHTQLPSRSHVSCPLPDTEDSAPAAAALLLRQAVTARRHDANRESVQSHSSYNSINTDTGVNTGRSSVTSLGSISSRSSRRLPPQKTMSSSGSLLLKKTHSRSSSLGGSAKTPLEIPCTYPNCFRTFTRDPDRIRHESSIHSTEVGYTCLLHTCTASCPDSCNNKDHNSPYQNSRADKMKEHLERIHGWRLKQSDIPKSFLKSYERQQRGWICACGTIMGSWHDNEDRIAAHSASCTEGLQTSFKRMSVEERSKDGDRKGGSPDLDKALPRTFNPEDEEWFKDLLQEWSQPH